LVLAAQVAFEFGEHEHAEHVEKCFAGGGACVDQLFSRL
jgi:hypothetical protein